MSDLDLWTKQSACKVDGREGVNTGWSWAGAKGIVGATLNEDAWELSLRISIETDPKWDPSAG